MTIGEWVKQIPTFKSMNVVNQMMVIGYYLHSIKNLERFSVGNVTLAFDELHLPSRLKKYLPLSQPSSPTQVSSPVPPT
jgi:hypothetical protein